MGASSLILRSFDVLLGSRSVGLTSFNSLNRLFLLEISELLLELNNLFVHFLGVGKDFFIYFLVDCGFNEI